MTKYNLEFMNVAIAFIFRVLIGTKLHLIANTCYVISIAFFIDRPLLKHLLMPESRCSFKDKIEIIFTQRDGTIRSY